MKTPAIKATLSYMGSPLCGQPPYRIERLTNAVKVEVDGQAYRIGDSLSEKTAEALTDPRRSEPVEVTVTPRKD